MRASAYAKPDGPSVLFGVYGYLRMSHELEVVNPLSPIAWLVRCRPSVSPLLLPAFRPSLMAAVHKTLKLP